MLGLPSDKIQFDSRVRIVSDFASDSVRVCLHFISSSDRSSYCLGGSNRVSNAIHVSIFASIFTIKDELLFVSSWAGHVVVYFCPRIDPAVEQGRGAMAWDAIWN